MLNGSMPQGRAVMRAVFLAVVLSAWIAPSRAEIGFDETTGPSGITYSGESWGATWCDVNGDGLPDLYTNNHRVEDGFWLNIAGSTFKNVARQIDIDGTWKAERTNDTHGATCADFDNDGDQDLLVSSGQNGNNQWGYGWRFFVNQDGLLDNQTAEKGFSLVTASGGRFPGWMDVNNDGRLDILAMNQSSSYYAHLYVQNPDGSFTNTTYSKQRCEYNHFMLLSDLDVNGRMEMICVGKAEFPDRVYDTSTDPFTDRTSSVPFTDNVQDTAIADFDNDLRPDIFHVRGGKRLSGAAMADDYSLEAQLIAEQTTEVGMSFVTTGQLTVNAGWDGNKSTSRVYIGSSGYRPAQYSFTLDPANVANHGIKPHSPSVSSQRGIYIGYSPSTQTWKVLASPGNSWVYTHYEIFSSSPISQLAVTGLVAMDGPVKPALYLNKESGFEAANLTMAGLNEAILCVDVVPGDFDNDGDVDLYVVCREAVRNIANRLYENMGNAKFALVPGAGGAQGVIGLATLDGAGTGETAVTADYNVDGFLDLFVANGLNERTVPRTGGPYQLFRNRANSNKWIQLDLQGVMSNRDGLGAKVFATTPNGLTQLREQNGGYHRWAQNHPRLHFGLAGQTSVDIRVEWPSGHVDEFFGVAVNKIYRVVENGSITPVFPTTEPPLACGPPAYDKSIDRAAFLWKDCSSGQWNALLTGGGGAAISISGGVVSSQGLGGLQLVSIESNDIVELVSPPATVIDYSLTVSGSALDRFNFTPVSDDDVCFGVDLPAGTQVLVGAGRLPVIAPFNLATLAPCN